MMIKLTFVGDIMCEEEQLLANFENNSYNFNSIFENIKPVFQSSDYVVGNLETPIAGQKMQYTNHKWSFNSPIEFACAVKNAGFDLVATSNNHSMDRAIDGLYQTIEHLDTINLGHTGTYLTEAASEKLFIKNIDGIKIAFLSYTYGTNAAYNNFFLKKDQKFAINLFGKQQKSIKSSDYRSRVLNKLKTLIIFNYSFNNYFRDLKQKIKQAKQEADLVVVLMHSGGQYNLIPDKGTLQLVDFLKNNGVDTVIGCHPHVVQKVIISKNRLDAFSLGNFCSYPGSDSCKMNESEYAIILHIFIDTSSKKLTKASFQITKSVVADNKKANIHLLYDLIQTEKDLQVKQKLIADNLLIYNRFLDKSENDIEIRSEYDVCSF